MTRVRIALLVLVVLCVLTGCASHRTKTLIPTNVGPDASVAPGELRVTLAGGCPARDRGHASVSNPSPALEHILLPSGAPSAGLLCTYNGINGLAFSLTARRLLGAGAADNLAAAVRHLRLKPPRGPIDCPMADGSAVIIALAYAGQPDVDLWYSSSGCPAISNSHVMAYGSLPLVS